MITLKDIRLNDARDKTFLLFDGPLSFQDDTIYFIIGLSGSGKTSIVDFMTAPFTDDPIKSGGIILSPDIALKAFGGRKSISHLNIQNSFHFYSRQYVEFIRKSVALIPQKTDSFHPAIPVVKQMYDYYKMALPKDKRKKPAAELAAKFNSLLETLSPYAGWDKISVCPNDANALLLTDIKEYMDENNDDTYDIIKKQNEPKWYEGEFSTGQLQRILILMGLLRFHVSDHPILIGDEFLVNFTYSEANDVLREVITFFLAEKQKKHKVAIFVLHDLSFEFLKNLSGDYPVRIIAVETDEQYSNQKRLKTETLGAKRITAHEIALEDFFGGKWKNAEEQEVFEKFKKSYEAKALSKDECAVTISVSDNNFPYKIAVDNDPYGGNVYKKIDLEIGKNRFIVLTGFSGCGKSTLCNQYVSKCIGDKKLFRYFPSRALSSLSEGSQISIRQDLSIMYNYYNGISGLDKYAENIGTTLEKVKLNKWDVKEFLDKKIYDLSGGELQRYWLSRILFNHGKENGDYTEPELLILDESIASLDCITKNLIIAFLLEEVLSRRGMTILFVSHDLRDINVIYKTILENAGRENIDRIFEHYEMFYKHSEEKLMDRENIFRVKTPFPEYCENLINRRANTYISLKDNRELTLRLKTAGLPLIGK